MEEKQLLIRTNQDLLEKVRTAPAQAQGAGLPRPQVHVTSQWIPAHVTTHAPPSIHVIRQCPAPDPHDLDTFPCPAESHRTYRLTLTVSLTRLLSPSPHPRTL